MVYSRCGFMVDILSESVCGVTVNMSKFRNIVVHDYTRIDPEIVVGILRNNLQDLKRLASEVIRFMDTLSVAEPNQDFR